MATMTTMTTAKHTVNTTLFHQVLQTFPVPQLLLRISLHPFQLKIVQHQHQPLHHYHHQHHQQVQIQNSYSIHLCERHLIEDFQYYIAENKIGKVGLLRFLFHGVNTHMDFFRHAPYYPRIFIIFFQENFFKLAKNIHHILDDPILIQMTDCLQNKFLLQRFRENQIEAIKMAISKDDCMIIIPTGAGKSLCYQLPAVMGGDLTLVVSPLISLINDQISKLKTLNINAKQLAGVQLPEEVAEIYQALRSNEIRLLYVTPEKLMQNEQFRAVLDEVYRNNRIRRFVIDEAHCVRYEILFFTLFSSE